MFASIAMGIIFALNGDPLGALMATILVGLPWASSLNFRLPQSSWVIAGASSSVSCLRLSEDHDAKGSTLLAITIPIIAFGIPLLIRQSRSCAVS